MATQWLRLWHEMPNDPKFRVVAKASDQPVSLVLALYTVLLVDASCNYVERGVTTSHNESHAVTLDCDMSQIDAIVSAMQGRLLDGQHLIGWEKRQPKREYGGDDETVKTSAAVRKREQRERDRAALSQQVTTSHNKSRLDKDKDKEVNPPNPPKGESSTAISFKTFLAKCKASGEKPISEYTPMTDYAEKVNLSPEFVHLAWTEFGRLFGEGGVNETKRQKDWRKTFRTYLEKNYLKLWWLDGDVFTLTTTGKQAKLANADRLRPQE